MFLLPIMVYKALHTEIESRLKKLKQFSEQNDTLFLM